MPHEPFLQSNPELRTWLSQTQQAGVEQENRKVTGTGTDISVPGHKTRWADVWGLSHNGDWRCTELSGKIDKTGVVWLERELRSIFNLPDLMKKENGYNKSLSYYC